MKIVNPIRRGSNLTITALVTYLGIGLSLVSAPIVVNQIGADGKGLIAGSFVAVQLLSWTAFLGLPRGLSMQMSSKFRPRISAFVILILLGLAASLLTLCSAGGISNGDAYLKHLIILASLVLPLAGLSQLANDYLLSSGKIAQWNIVRSFNLIIPAVTIIFFASLGILDVWNTFLVTLSCQGVASVISIILLSRGLHSKTAEKIPWKFSLHFWFASLTDAVSGRIDLLILTAISFPSVVGVYSIAVTCASAAGAATQALNDSSFHKIVQAKSTNSHELVKRKAILGLSISLVVGFAVFAAVSIFAVPVFGVDFSSLPEITAFLIIYQAISDQWRLQTYQHSAKLRGGILAISSTLGLVVFGIVILFLSHNFSSITGVDMSIAMVVLSIFRLCSFFAIDKLNKKMKNN